MNDALEIKLSDAKTGYLVTGPAFDHWVEESVQDDVALYRVRNDKPAAQPISAFPGTIHNVMGQAFEEGFRKGVKAAQEQNARDNRLLLSLMHGVSGSLSSAISAIRDRMEQDNE